MDQQGLKDRTKAYALRVIRLCSTLPKEMTAQVIGKQLLRSGTSVGANYREATRARSKLEFAAKLGDSLKELSESEYWLELLAESGIVEPAKVAPLMDETDQLTRIFVTSIRSSKKDT
jgi:four helix bundle protein